MKYYHEATDEWMDEKELQKRINKRFDFKCNKCHKSTGSHVAVAGEGIFCKPCQEKIVKSLQDMVERRGGTLHKF